MTHDADDADDANDDDGDGVCFTVAAVKCRFMSYTLRMDFPGRDNVDGDQISQTISSTLFMSSTDVLAVIGALYLGPAEKLQ